MLGTTCASHNSSVTHSIPLGSYYDINPRALTGSLYTAIIESEVIIH